MLPPETPFVIAGMSPKPEEAQASCLFDYLRKKANGGKICIMSDSCSGQNRNRNVSSMLMYAVQTLNIHTIEHCFFEPGHSYMECDTVHGHITLAAKRKEIFVPNDWYETISKLSGH